MAERLDNPAGLAGAATTVSDPVPDDDDLAAGAELSLLLPGWLTGAIERRRAAWTTVDTVAAWLIGLHLILLLVIVGRGSLYIDDLRAQGYALNQPFWRFILGSNGTHFAPIPRILDWTQSRYAPLEHPPATVVTLLVRLLLALGFWRVLRRLFGARPATVIPLAVLLLTPVLIPSTTWYRQSITIVACTVAMVWAIDLQLRWVLYRHRADLASLVVVTAIGLCCYEKAAAIPVILLALTLAIFAERWLARARTDTGRSPAAPAAGRSPVAAGMFGVLASSVVVVVFLVIYRSGPYDQAAGSLPTVFDVLRLSWDTTTQTMIPLLLGGPYHWTSTVPYAGGVAINPAVRAVCLLLVLAGFALAARRRPGQVWRALILLLAWTLPSVAIVAVGRFGLYGLTLAEHARLWADLVPGFLLVAALAVLPWQVGAERTTMTSRQPVFRAGRGAAIELTAPAMAVGLAVLVILAGSVISSLTYASAWWQNPTGRWIDNARASLTNAEPFPRMVATPLPSSVMPYWVAVTFPTDAPLLLLLRPDTRFDDGDGESKVMNAAGLRSAYRPKVLVKTKPAALCVAPLPAGGDRPVAVEFPTSTPYVVGAQLEVGLLLAESTKVEVSVVTPSGQVLTPQRFSDQELPQGPHTLHLPVPLGKTVSGLRVQIHATKTSCVAYAQIWVPVP